VNSSAATGGIWIDNRSNITVDNTIISNNRGWLNGAFVAADVGRQPGGTAGIFDATNDIIGAVGNSGIVATESNGIQIGVDPRLAPLAYDVDGLTRVHALLPGSPAIDGGSVAAALAAGLYADQRGYGRYVPHDGTITPKVDIGAYELGYEVSDLS